MRCIKYIAALLCFIMIAVFSTIKYIPSIDNHSKSSTDLIKSDEISEKLLDAASICHDLYIDTTQTDSFNVVLSSETILKMVNALSESGYTVIDENGNFNMQNPEQLLQYCHKISNGDHSTQGIYFTLYTDGHIGASQLYGNKLRSLSADFTQKPKIYLDITTPLKETRFTQKGWLIYRRDFSSQNNSKPFNQNEYTMVRVSPQQDEFRNLCENYISPIGYFEHNLFTTNWSETDLQALDIASIYAPLFGLLHNGETLNWYSAKQYYSQVTDSDLFLIPQEEFESVIQNYMNISISEIRSISEYSRSEQAYYFLGWQTGYYNEVPRLPNPEVIDAWKNQDGTLTLMIDAVFPWYGTDCAFQHETTIRCNDDGSFQFVSNRIIKQENNIFPLYKLPSFRNGAILAISK